MKTTKAQRDAYRRGILSLGLRDLTATDALDDFDEALALLKRARAAIDPCCPADAELMAEMDVALANHPAPEEQ